MLVGKKIIIFGASENGKCACKYLSANNEVLFVCDNKQEKWGTNIDKYKIVSPDCIKDHRDAVIVLAIVKRYHEVVLQLHDMNVDNIWQFLEYNNLITGKSEFRLRRIPSSFAYKLCIIGKSNVVPRIPLCNPKANKVLLFANYFPPIGGSGVQRPLKFAKYLKHFGYDPIIISKGNGEKALSMDYSLLDDLKDVDIIRLQESPTYPEEMSNYYYNVLCELFLSLGMNKAWIKEYINYLNRNWDTIPDMDVLWVLYCVNNIIHYVDLNDISLIYTTIGPYSSALFGAYMKIYYGINWVLDYRDPWCLNDYNMKTFYGFRMDRRDFEKDLEIQLLKSTDYVVAASEAYCKDFKNVCPEIKTTCITNGYDEDDFCDILNCPDEDKHFCITYSGFLYSNYDLKAILLILNELISEKKIDKEIVRLVFCGSDPANQNDLLNFDKNNIVRYRGYLQHADCIKMLYQSDILLLFGSSGESEYSGFNGKVFEYLRTGKPILNISNSCGVQYELIKKMGQGITATTKDSHIIKKFILDRYGNRNNVDVFSRLEPDDYLRTFSREYLTGRLAKVFDEVLSENR